MKTFEIDYYFDGHGRVRLKAENEEDAREAFYAGEYEDEDDDTWNDNYSIDGVTAINNLVIAKEALALNKQKEENKLKTNISKRG